MDESGQEREGDEEAGCLRTLRVSDGDGAVGEGWESGSWAEPGL